MGFAKLKALFSHFGAIDRVAPDATVAPGRPVVLVDAQIRVGIGAPRGALLC